MPTLVRCIICGMTRENKILLRGDHDDSTHKAQPERIERSSVWQDLPSNSVKNEENENGD